jgi:hypothetical protein
MLDRASAGSRAVRSVDLWKYDEHVVGESTSKEKALAYTVTLVQALARIEIGEVVSAPRVEGPRSAGRRLRCRPRGVHGTVSAARVALPLLTPPAGRQRRQGAGTLTTGLAPSASPLVMVVGMTEQDAYCDFCDLPMAQCVHGQPPAPKVAVQSSPKARKRAPARSRAPGPVTRPVNRRWTSPEELKPHILAVLEEADGELDAEELFLELEIMLGDRLLSGDRERTPTGEPRWQYAARRARVALINEGLMTKGIPGVWKLAKAP